MNIHFIDGKRIDTKKFRQQTKLKLDKSGTEQPRTREGIGQTMGLKTPTATRVLASMVYPGGKVLRRRQARLAVRQADFASHYQPGAARGEGYLTKPGAMK